jgi:hypothetical protein
VWLGGARWAKVRPPNSKGAGKKSSFLKFPRRDWNFVLILALIRVENMLAMLYLPRGGLFITAAEFCGLSGQKILKRIGNTGGAVLPTASGEKFGRTRKT